MHSIHLLSPPPFNCFNTCTPPASTFLLFSNLPAAVFSSPWLLLTCMSLKRLVASDLFLREVFCLWWSKALLLLKGGLWDSVSLQFYFLHQTWDKTACPLQPFCNASNRRRIKRWQSHVQAPFKYFICEEFFKNKRLSYNQIIWTTSSK